MLQSLPLSMNAVVRGLEPMLTRMIREDVRFRMTLDPQLSAIEADTNRIEQVLMNLVINAAEAIGHNIGLVEISTSERVLKEKGGTWRSEKGQGGGIAGHLQSRRDWHKSEGLRQSFAQE